MNLNNRALMKAVGVGAGLGVLVAIGNSIPFVNILCLCIGWLFFIAAGAAYGYFDQQDGGPADMQSWAIGGAISGAAAGLVWGVVFGIASAIITAISGAPPETLSQLEQAGLPPELAPLIGGVGAIFICGCLGLIIDAIFGALGGVIYTLIRRNQAPTMTPPPAV